MWHMQQQYPALCLGAQAASLHANNSMAAFSLTLAAPASADGLCCQVSAEQRPGQA